MATRNPLPTQWQGAPRQTGGAISRAQHLGLAGLLLIPCQYLVSQATVCLGPSGRGVVGKDALTKCRGFCEADVNVDLRGEDQAAVLPSDAVDDISRRFGTVVHQGQNNTQQDGRNTYHGLE